MISGLEVNTFEAKYGRVPHLAVIRLDKRPDKPGDYMIDVIFTTDEGGTIAAGGIVHFD